MRYDIWYIIWHWYDQKCQILNLIYSLYFELWTTKICGVTTWVVESTWKYWGNLAFETTLCRIIVSSYNLSFHQESLFHSLFYAYFIYTSPFSTIPYIFPQKEQFFSMCSLIPKVKKIIFWRLNIVPMFEQEDVFL